MLSHAANIAVPIWRGNTAFYSVSVSACALSPSLPLCSPPCCPHVLLPHQPLHIPSPTDGISVVHRMILVEKYVWKTYEIGAEGGQCTACPLLSWCPLCPKLHWSMQWTRGRAQSPGLLLPHPPWWNSCCTTNCLQLGDMCPLAISSGYFPQQEGQVHFGSFPISLWKYKPWEGEIFLFHWVMQIPIPCRKCLNKYPWYKVLG